MKKLHLIYTTKSNINISEPGSAYASPDTGWIYNQKPAGGGAFPCNRTKSLQVALPIEEGKQDAPAVISVPVIPGNYQRGALRKHAAAIVNERVRAKGQEFSFKDFFVLERGASTADIGKTITILQAAEAAKNPVVGLLGGGPKFIHSRWSSPDAVAVNPKTLDIGIVPEFAGEYSTSGPHTRARFSIKKDSILSGEGKVPEGISDFTEAVEEYLKNVLKSRETKDKEKGNKSSKDDSKKVAEGTVYAIESVMPNTSFVATHLVDDRLPGPAAFGLLLLAIQAFANEQRLGGHWRVGYGKFDLRTVFEDEDGRHIDLLSSVNGVYEITTNKSDYAKQAIEAIERYFENELDVDTLVAAFGRESNGAV